MPGVALERVTLKANLKGDASKVTVSGGILNLDESTLNFSLNASDFSRPNLTFDLNLDQINVDRYLPPKSEQKAAPEKPGSLPGGRRSRSGSIGMR